jgi:hypothetical protein
MENLQRMVKKYHVTKSGSMKQVAQRLRQVVPHIMTLSDLKKVEDFLRLPPSQRYKGERFYVQSKGKRIVRIEKRS